MMPFATNRLRRRFYETFDGLDRGQLSVTLPDGARRDFGRGGAGAELVLRDWAAVRAFAGQDGEALRAAYVAGLWEASSVELVARLCGGFVGPTESGRDAVPGNEFFQLWLDPGMSFSSALFAPGDSDLARGQARKNGRILDRIGGAERVLELGCGWGGFAEAAAERGHRVTATTISPAQKGYADARLDGRAEIRLEDFRDTGGRFDALVSVEMIEALGRRSWPVYFARLRDRLAEGGRAVVQATLVPEARGRRHGAHLPTAGAIREQAARAGLAVTDSFSFGADYATTCRLWAARLDAAAPRLRRLGHGEGILRAWRYRLGAAAAGFATGRADVVQVELAHAEGMTC